MVEEAEIESHVRGTRRIFDGHTKGERLECISRGYGRSKLTAAFMLRDMVLRNGTSQEISHDFGSCASGSTKWGKAAFWNREGLCIKEAVITGDYHSSRLLSIQGSKYVLPRFFGKYGPHYVYLICVLVGYSNDLSRRRYRATKISYKIDTKCSVAHQTEQTR